MKKVVIIDGQGGRMGRALVEEIHKLCPGQPPEKTPFSSPAAMPT